jgi:polyhydroxyalkanoate synthase
MAMARSYVHERHLMSGEELAHLFFWLRPTDLVWRYWINNYLMGRQPPRLDVLFWDNDSTRLPAAVHADFMAMYERDVFRQPHALTVLGRAIDFRKLAVDSYFVGGEDDYLMPWVGCYHACQAFRGRHQFVLSTSGHVQSILRPPQIADTHYHTHPDTSLSPADWRRNATRHDGSWWGHWHGWLNASSGPLKDPPQRLGSADFPPLDRAPGRYVFD